MAEAGPERRKAAPLGGSRILECPIVYKDGQWHEHVIRWHKQGIEVPILVQYDSYQPHLLPAYQVSHAYLMSDSCPSYDSNKLSRLLRRVVV